jgi:hypothetical protein
VIRRAKEIFIVKSFLRELDNPSRILRSSLAVPGIFPRRTTPLRNGVAANDA